MRNLATILLLKFKSYYVSGTKVSYGYIQKNIQIFAFKVPQEFRSWESRNGSLQMFFLTQNRNMFAEKFVK